MALMVFLMVLAWTVSRVVLLRLPTVRRARLTVHGLLGLAWFLVLNSFLLALFPVKGVFLAAVCGIVGLMFVTSVVAVQLLKGKL